MLFVISRAGPRETLGLMTNRIQTLFGRFRSLISRIWSRGSSGNHGDDSAFGVQDQFLVVEDYEPAPYEGRVLLFRSQLHQTGRFRDPELGWENWFAGASMFRRHQVITIPCSSSLPCKWSPESWPSP